MRKQLLIVELVFCTFLFGCKKDGASVVDTLTIPSEQETDIVLGLNESTTKISFDTSNDWHIDIYDEEYNYYLPPDNETIEWLKLSEEKGSNGNISINVDLTENIECVPRKAYIKVLSGNLYTFFQVTQDCKGFFICDDISVLLTAKELSFVVPVRYNKPNLFTVQIPKDVDWISYPQTKTVEEEILRFTLKENTKETSRNAEFKILALGEEYTITVLQLGKI